MTLLAIIAILCAFIIPTSVWAVDTPTQISPFDNATISQLALKLSWQYSGNCPADIKISCFRVELDTSTLFPNPKYRYTNSFSYSPQILTDGKWYWRVKAKDETGTWSDWSAIWSFDLKTSSPTPTLTPTPSPSLSPTPAPTSTPAPTPKPTSSFTVSNIPSQINSNQSFNTSVNLTLPNNKNSTYYLSGAFKKVGGTRYFGLTKIDSNWAQYNSSNYLNQYKITTDDSGNWTGTLEVKPDIEDSDYKGSGDYIFKVARYLSNSSPTWSNEAAITINDVTNDYNSDSSTPQPTLNIISSASPKPASTQSPTPKPTQSLKYSYRIASVAAATTSATAAVRTATSEAGAKVKNQKQNNPIIWIGIILIFAGLSSIGYIYLKSHGKIPIKF